MASGLPLEASDEAAEWCTASCPFSDGERLALARLELPSSTADRRSRSNAGLVVVVVFDLLRNEAVRRLRHPYQTSSSTSAEHISHLAVTSSNRYVVAGLQRASDDIAVFIIFDLSTANGSSKSLLLDASAEVCDHLLARLIIDCVVITFIRTENQ